MVTGIVVSDPGAGYGESRGYASPPGKWRSISWRTA
jgi:hypothetical protein